MYFYVFIILILTCDSFKFNFNIFNKPYFFKEFWNNINKNTNKIILRKSNILYTNENITLLDDKYKYYKLILLTPGGIDGFYMLGTITYIQEKYSLNNYIYSGASAGAWNGLILSYKKNKLDIINNLIQKNNIFNYKSLPKTQENIKNFLIENYKSEDFNFEKLFIGVTQLNRYKLQTNIYSDFYNLEDAIDCCIASSHIPLITNGLINKYADYLTFDGGLSSNPYISSVSKTPFIIKPDMWDTNRNNLFFPDNTNLTHLYNKGYYDSSEHDLELDGFFETNN